MKDPGEIAQRGAEGAKGYLKLSGKRYWIRTKLWIVFTVIDREYSAL